ncbi:MAG: ATP-binding cassette domain-containing protein [Corynebacterium sp.]|nr:ATP-binding cassette domain-containing protein [Corynebacterium sp.]
MIEDRLLMNMNLSEVQVAAKHRTILEIPYLEIDARPTLLLGANGAGKSTLLNVLAGLRKVSHGSVHTVGNVTLIEQQFRPIVGFNALEYCAYTAWLQGQKQVQARKNAQGWLEFVGLQEVMEQRCEHLSGGEQARLAIATGLNTGADTLLLDEPSAALDPLHKNEISRVYERIVAGGHRLLVSTHDAGEIQSPFQRVLVLDHGRICFDGACPEFFAVAQTPSDHPAKQLAQSFLRRRGNYAA